MLDDIPSFWCKPWRDLRKRCSFYSLMQRFKILFAVNGMNYMIRTHLQTQAFGVKFYGCRKIAVLKFKISPVSFFLFGVPWNVFSKCFRYSSRWQGIGGIIQCLIYNIRRSYIVDSITLSFEQREWLRRRSAELSSQIVLLPIAGLVALLSVIRTGTVPDPFRNGVFVSTVLFFWCFFPSFMLFSHLAISERKLET